MSLGYLEIFRIAADCFQVLLGVVLVVLLVRYKKTAAKADLSNWPGTEAGPFMHEFMLQSLKHQSEMSFDSIEKTISAERQNLLRLFDISHSGLESDPAAFLSEDINTEVFQMDDGESEMGIDSSSNRYQQVTQLATEGLKAPRIAKQLGIPRGEVELVLKMAAATEMASENQESAFGRVHHRR